MKLLDKQCDKLGIPIFDMSFDYLGKPEQAILGKYKEDGFIGSYSEGGAILTLLKACMLNLLAEYNTFGDRNDAVNRYLEAQMTILSDKKDKLIEIIGLVSETQLATNYQEIIISPFIQSIYPSLSVELGLRMFEAIGRSRLMKIAAAFSENPYQYRSGWPDLTLVYDDTIEFVEIKTTDNLHNSQLITIPMIMLIIPGSVSVCRLSKLQ